MTTKWRTGQRVELLPGASHLGTEYEAGLQGKVFAVIANRPDANSPTGLAPVLLDIELDNGTDGAFEEQFVKALN